MIAVLDASYLDFKISHLLSFLMSYSKLPNHFTPVANILEPLIESIPYEDRKQTLI